MEQCTPIEPIENSTYGCIVELTPIELLGYSKNNIVDAKNQTDGLPSEMKDKLSQAYVLLDEVQTYLYNH